MFILEPVHSQTRKKRCCSWPKFLWASGVVLGHQGVQMCRMFLRGFLAVSMAILWAVVKWEDKALHNGTGKVGRVLNALSSYQETDMEDFMIF